MAVSAAVGVVAVAGMAVSAISSSNAANAQANSAANALGYQENAQKQAEAIAQPSFQQMATIQQQLSMSHSVLSTQLGQLQQQQSLYSQAAGQASALMSGQNAATLAPMQQQIQYQQQQLENQLRQQLGPGYAATSSGQEALNRFSQMAEQTTVNTQQQAVGQYLGYANALGANYNQGVNSAYSTAGGLNNSALSQMGNIQANQVAAIRGTMPNFNPSIQTAGSGSTAGIMVGQDMTSLAGTALGSSLKTGGFSGGPTAPTGGGFNSGMSADAMSGASYANSGPTYLGGSDMASSLGNPQYMSSDRNMKKNIIQLAKSIFKHVPTYKFQYKNDKSGKWHVGAMAQDLITSINKNAVLPLAEGFYVDYSKVEVA